MIKGALMRGKEFETDIRLNKTVLFIIEDITTQEIDIFHVIYKSLFIEFCITLISMVFDYAYYL